MGYTEELENVGLNLENYAVITGNDGSVSITPFNEKSREDFLKIRTLVQRGWIFEYFHPIKGEEVEDMPNEFLIERTMWVLHSEKGEENG